MATTPVGAALTERYRTDQVAIRNAFLAEYFSIWTLLDPLNLTRTRAGWLQAVMRIIEVYRTSSARAAQDYVREFRQVEGGPDLPDLPDVVYLDTAAAERKARTAARKVTPDVRHVTTLARPVNERGQIGLTRNPNRQQGLVIDWGARRGAVQTSLEVTGPITIKSRTRQGMTEAQVEQMARAAMVESSGAASRHVMEGGRETSLTLLRADDRLLGYIRVTDANPCYFCAMLASRGPVYFRRVSGVSSFSKSDPRFSGDGHFKVHDHCQCQMEPVYSTGTGWPGLGKDLQRLWNAEIQRKYSGKDAIRHWRTIYNAWAAERGIETDSEAVA